MDNERWRPMDDDPSWIRKCLEEEEEHAERIAMVDSQGVVRFEEKENAS